MLTGAEGPGEDVGVSEHAGHDGSSLLDGTTRTTRRDVGVGRAAVRVAAAAVAGRLVELAAAAVVDEVAGAGNTPSPPPIETVDELPAGRVARPPPISTATPEAQPAANSCRRVHGLRRARCRTRGSGEVCTSHPLGVDQGVTGVWLG